MKNLIILNLTAPAVLAAAVIAAARSDQATFLLFMAFLVSMAGLAVVNLFAPLWLWKKCGPRSLLAPLAFLVAAALGGSAVTFGPRLVLAGTPSSPDSFLQGARQVEMERLAGQLLAGRLEGPIDARLQELGFTRVEVDTLRQVVTLGHYRLRTWYEYIYAANGLPPTYSTQPRLTEADIHNWGEVRRIADQGVQETKRSRCSIVFEPTIAVPCLQRALGDSFLRDLRKRPWPGRLTPAEKLTVVAAFNRQAAVASRLVEDPEIGYEGSPPELRVGAMIISDGFWVSPLLKSLLAEGVLLRAQDKRHLLLKPGLSEGEQHKVEWLQVGLMNFIYGNLLRASDYAFDRRLREHWYIRRW